MIMRTIKNKMFSPFRETWMRCWFEEKGMPGRGIDPVYDTYQYLTMTGQIQEHRGRFTLKLDGYKDDKTLTWAKFKALILSPDAKTSESTDVIGICRRQFANNEAFQRYFETLAGGPPPAPPTPEELAEAAAGGETITDDGEVLPKKIGE